MKTKMGFGHKLAYSFFDFAAYKEFLVQGFGKSILYLFLVTLIFSTFTNINTISKFNSEVSSIQSTFIRSAPNFELKNGLLSVDSDEPFYYKHDGQTIIVDTSGKTNDSALNSFSDGFYVNSDEIIIRQNYRTLQTLKFTDYAEFYLTNEILQSSFSILKILFPIMILVFGPILSFLVNLISGFIILGPITITISAIMGAKLKYSNACILSFYAMTLPLLLESLLNISGLDFPEFFGIFYIVALIYCGLAINKIKNIDKSNLNLSN